nr:aldolase/citrate lyase family protein [Pseudomonas sp. NFIX28]
MADQDLCVLVQIETQAALDKIEEVAAVESIDGLREWTSEAGLSNQCFELLMNISGIAHHLTYGRCLLFMSDRNLQSLLGGLAGVGSLMFTDVCS